MTNKPLVADTLKLSPQKGPQTEFLASVADITVYGGSAGGGKSYGLLLAPLRHIEHPGFNCVIFRRTSPQIRNAGALWDISSDIYPKVNGKPLESRLMWKWPKSPSGAEVRFAHMEYEQDKHNFDGSQICWLCFDELQQFTESMFFYMLSRNRSTCGIKPRVLCTCNPDSESWLRTFIDWWIGKDGLPLKERAGKIRYFMRVDGNVVWADSKNELLKNNEGFVAEYEAIRAEYLKEKKKIGKNRKKIQTIKGKYTLKIYKLKDMALEGIRSVTFIPSSVYDNKILLDVNPQYLSNLKALPLVERERLLEGNWNIKAESGKFFHRDWFEIVEPKEVPQEGVDLRFWDFASTAPSKKNKDPDYTVGVKIRKHGFKYFIIDVARIRLNPADVEKVFLETTETDKKIAESLGLQYKVRWEIEGGSSGKTEDYRLKSLLAGYDAKGVRSTGSKEVRARPLAVQCEIGNVKLQKADWNEAFLNELHMFTDDESKHDDMVDGCSGAFNELCSIILHPTIPDEKKELPTDPDELAEKRLREYKKLEEDFLMGDDIDDE